MKNALFIGLACLGMLMSLFARAALAPSDGAETRIERSVQFRDLPPPAVPPRWAPRPR